MALATYNKLLGQNDKAREAYTEVLRSYYPDHYDAIVGMLECSVCPDAIRQSVSFLLSVPTLPDTLGYTDGKPEPRTLTSSTNPKRRGWLLGLLHVCGIWQSTPVSEDWKSAVLTAVSPLCEVKDVQSLFTFILRKFFIEFGGTISWTYDVKVRVRALLSYMQAYARYITNKEEVVKILEGELGQYEALLASEQTEANVCSRCYVAVMRRQRLSPRRCLRC